MASSSHRSSSHNVKKKPKESTQNAAVAAAAPIKIVYLIRHAQSQGQTAKQFGIDRKRDMKLRDCGLSPKGIKQALQIPSLFLADQEQAPAIQLVISSPLTRALETAVLGFQSQQQEHPIKIVVHFGLREIGSSLPENIPRSDMNQVLSYIQNKHRNVLDTSGGIIDTQTLQPPQWPNDDNNTHANRVERIHRIFQWIATERPEQCIAVVCHYNVIRAALGSPDIRPGNAVPMRYQLRANGDLIPY